MKSILPLEECKQRLLIARQNGDDELEYTGGEPTMHPQILEIIKFAKRIGFKEQRIITNGFMTDKFQEIIDAGVKQFLLSIHALGEDLDKLTQVKGSFEHMLKTIEVLKKNDCEIYMNVTMIKQNVPYLDKMAQFAIDNKFNGMNFINWNEYYDNQKNNAFREVLENIQPMLEKAIDKLEISDIPINIRYYPMCCLKHEYRTYCVNMPQVTFDPWEWSSMATDFIPKTKEAHHKRGRELQKNINSQEGKCGVCGIKNACGGCNKNYVINVGDKELMPQEEMSDFPYFYKNEYEADIIIPSFLPAKNLRLLEAEIEDKTIPPFNIIKIRKFQSAAKNRNYGLNRAKSPYVIMIDDDICDLPYGWNRRLIRTLKHHPRITAVSARLMQKNGMPGLNSANNFDLKKELIDCPMIPTACCVFRNPDRKYGVKTRFDERYIGSYWEDTDFFRQLQKDESKENFLIDNRCKVVHLNDGKGGNNVYNKNLFESKWVLKNEMS